MEDIEIPHYFICPISLQIMKDPVTAITGITYDRESIEHWLLISKNTTCPVTKQPLPLSDADLTPNHTLRRLIQAWCSENSSKGVERIPTPKPPLEKAQILKLLKDLDGDHHHQLKAIKRLETLAAENERNRKFMVETGVVKAVFSYIAKYCFLRNQTEGLEQALSILHYIGRIKNSTNNMKSSSGLTDQNLFENEHIMDSLTWVLSCTFENNKNHIKAHTVFVLKSIVEKGNPNDLSRLKPEFFRNILEVVKNSDKNITHQGLNAALQILLQAGPYGRNRTVMVQYGAVFDLVELEINSTERKTTELVFGILFHLCSCAEGRAQFLSHKASIFVVSRRILRVSQAVDDRAVMIFSLICRFSGTKQVLREMLEFGAVSRLCVLLQVECAGYLKERAREMLKTHSGEWKDSPCIDESHYPR